MDVLWSESKTRVPIALNCGQVESSPVTLPTQLSPQQQEQPRLHQADIEYKMYILTSDLPIISWVGEMGRFGITPKLCDSRFTVQIVSSTLINSSLENFIQNEITTVVFFAYHSCSTALTGVAFANLLLSLSIL